MNMIYNSCVGSRIYEITKKQYNNPFMWNVIPYSDFRKLIMLYDKIDLRNFDVSIFKQSDSNSVAKAVFDSEITVYYIHYHQSERYKTPTKIDIDIYSNDIVTYTKNAIIRRLDRMYETKEEPIFLFETRDRKFYNAIYTESDINDFIGLDTDYKKILLVNKQEFKNYPKTLGNCNILYYEDKYPNLAPNTVHMGSIVYNNFKDIIINEI